MQRALLHPQVQARLKRLPSPHEAHYGVVPLPPPSKLPLFDTNRDCAAALTAMGRLDELLRVAPSPFVATRILTRQEAVSSSSIEGTQSTLDEVLALDEQSGADAHAAVRQVRSYSLALERALDTVRTGGVQALTLALIQSLHRDLMTQDPNYPETPGEFRTRVVWIGGLVDIAYSTYNPCPPADIPSCMEEHVQFLHGDGMEQFLPLPIRMALAHAHFEAIHPFRDGNGRVGRLLLPLMMVAEGHQPLFLAPYLEAHRSDYYETLREAQQRLNFTPLANLLSRSITASVDEVKATYDALAELPGRWQTRGRLRSGSTALRSLDVLPSWPVVTVGRLAELLGVSFQAANEAVKRLVDLQILRERSGYQHNRLFVAPDVLRVLNRPFGQAPIVEPPST